MTKQNKTDPAFDIRRFTVYGLNDIKDVSIELTDSKLILVGENGKGKTTLLSIFYYVCTKQWYKVLAYNFKRIEILTGSSSKVLINRQDLLTFADKQGPYDNVIGQYVIENHPEMLENRIPHLYREVASELSVPTVYVRDYLGRMRININSELISNYNRMIDEVVNCQIVYMPTYRRIEQDIRQIFPEMAHKLQEFIDSKSAASNNYVEFVEFGMNDVKGQLSTISSRLSTELADRLVNLTRSHLADIMSKKYLSARYNKKELSLYVSFLQDMNEYIKDVVDIQQIDTILKNTQSRKTLSEHEKIVVYFLGKLVGVFLSQSVEAEGMFNFSNLINEYLNDKVLLYNPRNFSVKLYHSNEATKPFKNSRFFINDKTIEYYSKKSEIDLKDLSSGEKQIVSLFSHVYLSPEKRMFVIIDEPELSLSIPWQKKILPDLLQSEKVIGIFAVTHSPFVFDNELEEYAHDIAEFEVSHVLS